MSYAAFRVRIYAFLLDYLVIVVYGVFVVGTISFVFQPYLKTLFSSSPLTAVLTGFLMMTLPVSLYFIICECSKWQGTLVKRKIGIRIVDDLVRSIGVGRSVFRTGVKLLLWAI